MDILASNNTPARECYQAASIAARIHYTSRKDVETCSYALQRTALTPRDRAATLANRGIIYMSLEDYQKAIQDYSAALTLKPEFGELNVNIGNVYFLGKSFDKALVEYSLPVFWGFFLLTGIALFVLRAKEPDAPRPFKVPMYPVVPAIFVLMCGYLLYSSLTYHRTHALVGLGVLAVGAVVLLIARIKKQ